MDTFDAISQRRSVKHYDPEHRLTEDEITKLMEAAICSPTSFNMQNRRFVLVTDAELRKELCAAAFNQAQVTDASLLIVVTADLLAWKKEPERYWRDAPEEVRSTTHRTLGSGRRMSALHPKADITCHIPDHPKAGFSTRKSVSP